LDDAHRVVARIEVSRTLLEGVVRNLRTIGKTPAHGGDPLALMHELDFRLPEFLAFIEVFG